MCVAVIDGSCRKYAADASATVPGGAPRPSIRGVERSERLRDQQLAEQLSEAPPLRRTQRCEQIAQTVPAAEISLSQEDLSVIDNVLRDEVPVGGPAPEAMPKS